MREKYFHLILWVLILSGWQIPSAPAQMPVNPTANQLIQILRSQPPVNISAPVAATASFDPPLARPGEKSIYRVMFNATEVAIRWPELPRDVQCDGSFDPLAGTDSSSVAVEISPECQRAKHAAGGRHIADGLDPQFRRPRGRAGAVHHSGIYSGSLWPAGRGAGGATGSKI